MVTARPVLLALLALAALLPSVAQAAPGDLGTVTGKPTVPGPPTSLGQTPQGLAVRDGKLYVADSINHVVWVMNADGTGDEKPFIGDFRECSGACGDGGPVSGARISRPTSLVFDKQGNLFIGEAFDRIRVVRADGSGAISTSSTISTFLGSGSSTSSGDGGPASAAHVGTAASMVVTAENSLVIAAGGYGRVRIVTAASSGGASTLDTTDTISTLAGDGTQCNTNNLPACNLGGAASAAKLSSPTNLAIDGNNVLFIADGDDNLVTALDPGGDGFLQDTDTLRIFAGTGQSCPDATGVCGNGGPATSAPLSGGSAVRPLGVSVIENMSGRTLVIADAGQHRLRLVPYTSASTPGTITAPIGSGADCPVLETCDGTGAAARFAAPHLLTQGEAGTLYVGDQVSSRIRRVTGPPSSLSVVTTIAGTGDGSNECTYSACGDGGPAVSARVRDVKHLIPLPDGGVLLQDRDAYLLRRIDGDGRISTLGGSREDRCTDGSCGDNGPLSSATLGNAAMARSADGTVWTTAKTRLRAITPDGEGRIGPSSVVKTVAGSDDACSGIPCPDGAASGARFGGIQAVAVSPRTGEVAILDFAYAVRFLSADRKTVSTVVGGNPICDEAALPCGDGGPASEARIAAFGGLAFGPNGDLFLADFGGGTIRRIAADADGKVTGASRITSLMPFNPGSSCTAPCGDGGPASGARVRSGVRSVAVDPSGSVTFLDGNRARRIVSADGTVDQTSLVEAVAGTGEQCSDDPNDALSYLACGDGGTATAAKLDDATSLTVAPDYGVLIGSASRVNRVEPSASPTAGLTAPAGATVGVPVTLALSAAGPNPVRRWTLEFGDGTSAAGVGTPPATVDHTYGAPAAVTAKLTVLDGRSPSASATTPITVAPFVAPPDRTAPVLSALKVTPGSFRPAAGTTATAAAKRPKGGAIAFTVSEPATVTLVLTRGTKTVGTLTRAAKAGANSVPFTARLKSGRLSAGSYKVAAVAVDPAGNRSGAQSAAFKVVGIDAKASIRKRTKKTAISAKGVLVAVTCGDACRIKVTLKLGKTTIGSGKAGAKTGTQLVRVTFTKKGLKAFRKAKKASLAATVTVTDDVGTPQKLTAKRRLR